MPPMAVEGTETPASAVPRGLVGFANFKRHNPLSDKFSLQRFHHIEFYCGDATSVSSRFSWGLGMPLVAKSDLSTGNPLYASRVLRSNNLVFIFTAPYGNPQLHSAAILDNPTLPLPYFSADTAHAFFKKHGLAVRAVGVLVGNAAEAYSVSTASGGVGVQPPTELVDKVTGAVTVVAEVELYGDVVLRYVEEKVKPEGAIEQQAACILPNYVPDSNEVVSYGLGRLDHAVGNVPELMPVIQRVAGFTGMHEFAEFTAEDVGTVDSGLNSMVLANNAETVLLPMNEPTFGTKRKSQIQTYLEHNDGAGLQHLALTSTDIVRTLREMRARCHLGGFDFMPRPSPKYYRELPAKIGPDAGVSEELLKQCEEVGILIDRDDQGTLLQIFTKPVGDRPTLFLEIIQRVGCMEKQPDGSEVQKGGCGGFGKGNFSELFKSIEDFERTLDGTA